MNIPAINIGSIPTATYAKPPKVGNVKPFQHVLNKQISDTKSKLNNPSSVDIKSHMNEIKKHNPTIRNSYNNTIDANHLDETGMKIALKELAKRFENQIQSILWHQMFKKENGSMAEKLWSSERTAAFVDAGDDELGDIGESVYEQLLEEMKMRRVQN